MTFQIRKRVRFSSEAEQIAPQTGELARDLLRLSRAVLARDGSSGGLLATLDAATQAIVGLLTATFGDAPVDVRSVSGAAKFDWNEGQKQEILLVESLTSVQFVDPPGIGNFMLKIQQDTTGGRAIGGWPSNLKWPAGTVPVITAGADAIDVLAFYFDGTNYYGVASQAFA